MTPSKTKLKTKPTIEKKTATLCTETWPSAAIPVWVPGSKNTPLLKKESKGQAQLPT